VEGGERIEGGERREDRGSRTESCVSAEGCQRAKGCDTAEVLCEQKEMPSRDGIGDDQGCIACTALCPTLLLCSCVPDGPEYAQVMLSRFAASDSSLCVAHSTQRTPAGVHVTI
jgi:hypothetical protein